MTCIPSGKSEGETIRQFVSAETSSGDLTTAKPCPPLSKAIEKVGCVLKLRKLTQREPAVHRDHTLSSHIAAGIEGCLHSEEAQPAALWDQWATTVASRPAHASMGSEEEGAGYCHHEASCS
jgi:hypothetical protein